MSLDNWKFALGYGLFFLLWGVYNVVRGGAVSIGLGIVMFGVGIAALSLAARAHRRESGAAPPSDDNQSNI